MLKNVIPYSKLWLSVSFSLSFFKSMLLANVVYFRFSLLVLVSRYSFLVTHFFRLISLFFQLYSFIK